MSDLNICRICLRTYSKMYHFSKFQLKCYYEELVAMKVNETDALPQCFCYECATMLHKFHKFKEKCYVALKTFRELLWRGPITNETASLAVENEQQLQSALDILIVSSKVKTFISQHDGGMEAYKEIRPKIVRPKVEHSIIEDSKEEEERIVERVIEFVEDSYADHDDKLMNPDKDPVANDTSFSSNFDPPPAYEEPAVEVKDNFIEKEEIADLEENHFSDDNIDDAFEEKEEKVEDDDLLDEIKDMIPLQESEKPASPSEVFIDMKKKKGILKMELVKKSKKRIVQKREGLRKKNAENDSKKYKFTRPSKKRLLDEKKWKKFVLSEEEAVQEFRARAETSRYQQSAYKCNNCFKGFSRKDILTRHVKLKHAESLGQLECRFCRMRFKWDCYLRRHMRQHYHKFECLQCGLVCPLETTALLHQDYHNGVIKKCMHCGDEFKHSSTYYTHLRTHRSDYICTLCGESFVSELGLHMHKKVKHINDEIESPDEEANVNTYCEKCQIRFETRRAYEEHMFHSAMHDDGLENDIHEAVPRKILGKKAQEMINRLRKRKTLADDLPSFERTSRKSIKRYKRNHRKPTTCHQCGKHFDTQAACMKHHLSDHPRTSFFAPSERHICEICGVSLAPGSVATHINMHTREKLHSCDTCGRSFHASIGLKRHLLTHTGEKPYACTLCDKRFTQSNSMKLHYNTFHLKQPYPKRNRRKKKDEPAVLSELTGTREHSREDSSDESLPEPDRRTIPGRHQDDMHYLTLG